jgi:hypothetical protein
MGAKGGSVKTKVSKNRQACAVALEAYETDEEIRANSGEFGTGPRGVVNARALGLSRHPVRAPRVPRRRVVPARLSTAASRAGNVRGKHRPRRLKGFERALVRMVERARPQDLPATLEGAGKVSKMAEFLARVLGKGRRGR